MNPNPPLYDFALMEDTSEVILKTDLRLLQGHLLEPSPAGHLQRLRGYAQPRPYDLIVDMGCGFGELALNWHTTMPTLRFILVNRVATQLVACPPGPNFETRHVDAHDTGLPDNCADMVLFTYSLCHMDAYAALGEAARIVKPGGGVFLYELVRDRAGTDGDRMIELMLWSRLHTGPALAIMAEDHDLRLHGYGTPTAKIEPHFEDMLRREGILSLLDGLRPAVMRFQKEVA